MISLFHTHKEQQKCILMSLLIFMTVVGYNIMRGMKETVLRKLSATGAASYIPFVKIFLVMPVSIILGFLYLYLRHKTGISRSYYVVSSVFLAYFALFTFHIIPNIEYYTADPDWILSMQTTYPFYKYIIGLMGNLPSALYYVFAELWGTFTLVIMFWSMANDIFTTDEASRVYPILSLFSSVSIIVSSYIIKSLSICSNPLEQSTLVILALGICMLLIVYKLNPSPDQKQTTTDTSSDNKLISKKSKKKMPLYQSFKTAVQTPHILYMAICVVSFSILINIVETSLKEKLYFYYDTDQAYLDYYSFFTYSKGTLSLLANFCNVYLLRKYGWFRIAMITPVLCIITANFFLYHNAGIVPDFIMQIFQSSDMNFTMMWVACYGMIGTYAAKYAFFDTTQQMAYIPLPEEIRANGKAAADGIGGRLGKSGSGFILSGLLAFTAAESSSQGILHIAPYLIIITTLLSILWIWAMLKLSHSYYSQLNSQTESKITQKTFEETNLEDEADTGKSQPEVLTT